MFWLFFLFPQSSCPFSVSPRCRTSVYKCKLAAIGFALNSVSIRIFTLGCDITYPLSWSHKPLIRIALWVFMRLFCSFQCISLASQFFLLGLLLFFLENTHFIGSCHTRTEVVNVEITHGKNHYSYFVRFFKTEYDEKSAITSEWSKWRYFCWYNWLISLADPQISLLSAVSVLSVVFIFSRFPKR